ncbi:MAG: DNA-3-methyladenine glycosylase [Thermomicrobiales bacterium]
MDPDRRIVDEKWFQRHPVVVAFDLIGTVLRVQRDGADVSGRIVEVEAYAGPLDLASHSARMKAALKLLSGEPGSLYIYRSYGIHTMLNVVAHEPGGTGGILIRALEPLTGLNVMQARRGGPGKNLAKGPGVLTQALGVRLADVGLDLKTSDEISLYHGDAPRPVLASARIGISRGLSANWRFFDAESRDVSAHRRGVVITRDDALRSIPPAGTIIV